MSPRETVAIETLSPMADVEMESPVQQKTGRFNRSLRLFIPFFTWIFLNLFNLLALLILKV